MWAGWTRVFFSPRQLATMLYYVAVLLGLLVLYGRGEFSPAGFIYQAF
jgi:hypothetical protein